MDIFYKLCFISFFCSSGYIFADQRYLDQKTEKIVVEYIDTTNAQIIEISEHIKLIVTKLSLLRQDLFQFEQRIEKLIKGEDYDDFPVYKPEFPPYRSGSSLNP